MWYKEYQDLFEVDYETISSSIFDEINEGILNLQSDEPLISIVVTAYNEERILPACLLSLSRSVCKYPVEIIGIDNNSTDHTAEIYKKSGVLYFKEEKQGYGHARNCGLYNSRGKYHICIDSDTIYPPTYVECMLDTLVKKKGIILSATYGFISTEYSMFNLAIYEMIRNVNATIKSVNRPESVVRGAVIIFIAEPVRAIGFRTNIKRGEDGALAYELKSRGKIVFSRKKSVCAMTSFRSVRGSASIWTILYRRIVDQVKRMHYYFYTKTAEECKDEDSNLIK